METGVITKIGRQKLCKAHAGEIPLPKITKMGFGSGGCDDQGQPLEATGAEVALREELIQKEITAFTLEPPDSTTCTYRVKLEKAELTGEFISEQGLFDAQGDLVAYKTFTPKGKDGDMEFTFEMQEIF